MKEQNKQLNEKKKKKNDLLKRLAAEYNVMGRDCEKEGMPSAAKKKKKKALELYPDIPEAIRRIKKLEKKNS